MAIKHGYGCNHRVHERAGAAGTLRIEGAKSFGRVPVVTYAVATDSCNSGPGSGCARLGCPRLRGDRSSCPAGCCLRSFRSSRLSGGSRGGSGRRASATQVCTPVSQLDTVER